MFTLDRVLAATAGRVVRGTADPSLTFNGGAFDSRILTPGSLFFALRDKRDGHDFVGQALDRGALGAVVERIPDGLPPDALLIEVTSVPHALRRLADAVRDDHPIPAVGITGNVGKTTAKQATVATLGARYRVLATESSFNNEIGVPMTWLAVEATHEAAVIELGFYVPGEIADLCLLVRPRIGIITRIPAKPVHFERTPSVEAIAAGKAELIASLPADGVALLNADDERVRSLASRTRARVVLYGESPDAELRATDVVDDGLDGLRFTVRYQGKEATARLPVPGRHFIASALPAIAAAVEMGVPLEEAAVALSAMEPPAHRMRVVRQDDLTVIDDTYNASPAAVSAALSVLAAQDGRRVAVIGDMRELGALSASAHEEAGREAATSADVLVTVGDLARTIARSAREASHSDVYETADGGEALVVLRRILRAGDVVLIKGSRALELDRVVAALTRAQPAAAH